MDSRNLGSQDSLTHDYKIKGSLLFQKSDMGMKRSKQSVQQYIKSSTNLAVLSEKRLREQHSQLLTSTLGKGVVQTMRYTEEEEEGSVKSPSPSMLSIADKNIAKRLLCPPPGEEDVPLYERKTIPFHIPHKRLLEKIEHKQEVREPLTGFLELQNRANRAKEDKSFYESSETTKISPSESEVSSTSESKTSAKVVLAFEDKSISYVVDIGGVGSSIHTEKKSMHQNTISMKFGQYTFRTVANVVDQKEIIQKVRTLGGGKFVYMKYAAPKSSEYYTPYCLMVVPYEKVDKKNFLTLSATGVLQHRGGDITFTPLEKWEEDYYMYCRLMSIKTFFYFRLWKAFYVWRKTIIFEKMEHAKKFLTHNLFILNPLLRKTILDVRSMCCSLWDTSYADSYDIEDWYLFYFIEVQMTKMEYVDEKVDEFREVTRELVNNACHGALLDMGYIVDEVKAEEEEKERERLNPIKKIKTKEEKKDKKTSFINQANKKLFCERLTSFITMIDYYMVDMLHQLMINSISEMHSIIEQHFKLLPTVQEINEAQLDTIFEIVRPEGLELPLFITDVHMTIEEIELDPPDFVTLQIIEQVIGLWFQHVRKKRKFITDPLYKPFTNPMINGKIQERICGFGPPLVFYLDEDQHLNDSHAEIYEMIRANYEVVMLYLQRMEHVREFYRIDCEIPEETINDERDLNVFRGWLVQYNEQLALIESIVDDQFMGLFNLKFEEFKDTTNPQPERLLGLIEHILPWLGRDKITKLLEEEEEISFYLNSEPVSTVGFVEFIMFIDNAPGKVDVMETVLEYCKELYDMIEEYKIQIMPDDMDNYLGLSVTLQALRNLVDSKTEERAKYVDKLNDQINKDISALISEVGTIKDECIRPWLIDSNSSGEEAIAFLDGLLDHCYLCKEKAEELKKYQKQFRLEVTRFDMLDEVLNDVKLRKLLWESMDLWEKTLAEWNTQDFNTLDCEEMQMFVAKNVKNVSQLEKGLPPNLIVPKLKESVDTMKDKLPIIAYLRNPALRQRHWMKIENVLNHKFKTDEMITLEMLTDLKMFNYPEDLMEISGQASSEAGLEALLNKVEDAWKALEFSVVAHRDSKDVFILGSTEEVQTVLDESFININTIASSRHVGPIKTRVEDWLRTLELFSKTLEEWTLCQQSWLYLEVIFSAPDIQRQLPNEARMFLVVDKSWKEIMRRTAKMPIALEACLQPNLLQTFQKNNALLEQIMKCLETYLETKRVSFPRFYFLSNDELLDILAQTRNPFAVQPHLRKCFDAISKLEFGTKIAEDEAAPAQAQPAEVPAVEGQVIQTTDILGMHSPEGEYVALGKGLKARGNVEDWLGKVEDSMFTSLRKLMKFAIGDYLAKKRDAWVLLHPNQIVLTVSQIMWARQVHKILDHAHKDETKISKMEAFEKQCIHDLNKLAAVTRTDISKVARKVLIALITIDVHARDTISNLVSNLVVDSNDFTWLKMLRYYWMENIDNCVAKMSSAEYVYGYEYLGAGGVLVITPLTDKCYLCLMGALQLDLGGAPAGPAGTGKTETTKDLAKSLAIQCVVFNCSEGLDFKMMGRFFSGLAQSGAWCCFDEFNRIDIEVLSVIAQQLITIRNAKHAGLTRFMFEGREIKLVRQCSAFITMNPGYAGRTELPDNLKALFRPISMMVPDYALIAEVTLYSEGFESSKLLAQKMVQMYKLCSEQLSQQDHYDFGMRAVKSVLVMAGSLKRASPDRNEDVVLICALRDSNLPKFLADDAQLFQGILSDLFPGVELPVQDYGVLQSAMEEVMEEMGLQKEICMIRKVIQLYETMIVRWGVMLVGPTGGGKSTILKILNKTLTKLHEDGYEDPYYQPVQTYIMNPKAVTIGELYGEVNPFTMEWRDGLMGIMVRTAVNANNEDHQWVICDGPVDAVWIENLNTVLDDNKMLCLANSERIKLTQYVHMVFEVQDLAQASPATVSRCGMVYVDAEELKWLPYVKTFMTQMDPALLADDLKELLVLMFETYVEEGFTFIKKYCLYAIHQVDISKVSMMCALIKSLLEMPNAVDKSGDKGKVKSYIMQIFIFAYLWGAGGNLSDISRVKFEESIRPQFEDREDIRLSVGTDLWLVYMNTTEKRLEQWNKIIPEFVYDPELPFFETLVPTTDTVRFGFVMERLLYVNYPVLLTGDTGVGKSIIAKGVLNTLGATDNFVPVTMNFSAQTSSSRTQEILEIKLEKRKKTLLAGPVGKRVVVFVDDVNMPKLETYGAQPPIELLRQYLDYKGLYDREKLFWKDIQDMIICTACAPPGGGRNPLTPRFVRHFGMLLIPPPNEFTLKQMFKAIMKGFLDDFSNQVRDLGENIVNAAVEVYSRIAEDLLPTPAKSHYVFNLRDLSKCIQGILQSDSGTMREVNQMLRLFYHEALRVFHDRLINVEDKSYFYFLMEEICKKSFGTPVLQFQANEQKIIDNPPTLIFGDFMTQGDNRLYEEITNMNKLREVLRDNLEDYNLLTAKEMRLIFFMDAIEHCARIARILRAERGNALLVGVGGMGKQSLTKLASHLNGYKCFQIELTKAYDHSSFFEDIRKIYFAAGAEGKTTTFLFTDTQIVQEEFLEDINNMINSGDVPNLFESDDYEKVIIAVRPHAVKAGIADSNRDGIYDFFIRKVQSKLHLAICMSPVGDAFRRRCRMFPSLVNCCTIDWFLKWPKEALLSVAENGLKGIGTIETSNKLASICVIMHESVEDMTERFYAEMRRHYYTTPSSYLELLKAYKSMLAKKKDTIIKTRDRIANGLNKLYETNSVIDSMKHQLEEMAPVLEKKSKDVDELMANLAVQQKEADRVKQVVSQDEEEAKIKAQESQALADEAQKDLDIAMPAMEAAAKALEALNKNDINELKAFQKPPTLVKFVMESVCILLGAKTDWATAKSFVLSDINFLKKLQEYDKNNISETMLRKLKPYIEDKNFTPEAMASVSKVCKSIVMWVKAIDQYAKIYKVVEPKRLRQQAAEKEFQAVMAVLREKQRQLAEVEAEIERLIASFNASVAEKKELEDEMELTSGRLVRAGRLTMALGDEQTRWEHGVKQYGIELYNTMGDVLIAAACVAYLGAFTITYRQELVELWVGNILELEIPASKNFDIIHVLADPYDIRMWNTCGLPRDEMSTENAILVTQAGRWPLMIDPQEQANRWIRNMEADNNLKVCKLTDSNFMRVLEMGIRLGLPVLLEEVGETLDPTLGPILQKQMFLQSGRLLIRLGDTDVDYDMNFKFYVTTKLANPHYLPEVCIQVTIVNFTVTPSGLEDQLLADVVRLERPDLESLRSDLIIRINNDKQQLKNIEDKILKLLFASEGNILDDEELIDTLNDSKETSGIIAARLLETEATEEKISVAREKYRTVATRGSVLYFVVAQLAEIDPMYQYSLKYFTQVFNTVIETSEKNPDLPKRLQILYDEITLAIYTNVSRGLFERHKLVFSFMLCVDILKQANEISDEQYNYLMRGPLGAKLEDTPHKPKNSPISDAVWLSMYFLEANFATFKGIIADIERLIDVSIGDYDLKLKLHYDVVKPSSKQWDYVLSDFEKLMLIRTIQEEKLVFAITEYVKERLGQAFIESPQVSLQVLYQDTSNVTPLIFVLSTGSDPFTAFQRFAGEMGYLERIQSISLGQGQGPVAEKMIDSGKLRGDWVFLQNCHLATSWMLPMERIIQAIANDPVKIHAEFRIYMSSMPSDKFPVSVLQNSVKVTNEPPKGLRANVKRALTDMDEDFLEGHVLGQDWRTMIFGICMFHAVIQERKKFGPLGWNIIYEFNDSDREFAFNTLKMFCAEGRIPWDALEYITGEITYGGRVTDYWDLRCLKTILKLFFSPQTLYPRHKYSQSGVYFCPHYEHLEDFRKFVDLFPIIEEPEIFGMHENANIAFQKKETQSIILTILESQPRSAGHGGGKSNDEIVYELAEEIQKKIMKQIPMDACNAKMFIRDDKGRMPSLTTVLTQEVDRFNKLLTLMHTSLKTLKKAIKGLVVMSEQLEEVFKAFINNQVPKLWAAKAYPSLKSLGSWVHDLSTRLDFICIWILQGPPFSFWISGFFFPQGFLTGTLQTHARKYDIPIDTLKFEFDVQNALIDQDMVKLAHESNGGIDTTDMYANLRRPFDGVIIHGLFLDAGRWDYSMMVLIDAKPGEINPPMPAILLTPTTVMPEYDPRYITPLYKTAVRAGVLSTTGHSTNFVVAVLLPSEQNQSYWILKGTALLTQVTD